MTIEPTPENIAALAKAKADIESLFLVNPVLGDFSKAPTGELYIGIVTGGTQEDWNHFPCVARTPEDAIRLWKEAVLQHAAGKTGVLYWRELPELDAVEMFWEGYDRVSNKTKKYGNSNIMWKVYSRLLISDKPTIQPATWSAEKTA